MEFDAISYLISGAPQAPAVIFLVVALTFAAGKLGAQGKAQFGIAAALGFLFGGGLQAATHGFPADFAGWFWLVVYAGIMAITPSLLYEQAKDLLAKAVKPRSYG